MKITYDKLADAAYVLLGGGVSEGEAVSQVSLIDTPNGEMQITIDFDKFGYLLGFEILSASTGVHKDVLESAESL